jgi:hypothetical protein
MSLTEKWLIDHGIKIPGTTLLIGSVPKIPLDICLMVRGNLEHAYYYNANIDIPLKELKGWALQFNIVTELPEWVLNNQFKKT